MTRLGGSPRPRVPGVNPQVPRRPTPQTNRHKFTCVCVTRRGVPYKTQTPVEWVWGGVSDPADPGIPVTKVPTLSFVKCSVEWGPDWSSVDETSPFHKDYEEPVVLCPDDVWGTADPSPGAGTHDNGCLGVETRQVRRD